MTLTCVRLFSCPCFSLFQPHLGPKYLKTVALTCFLFSSGHFALYSSSKSRSDSKFGPLSTKLQLPQTVFSLTMPYRFLPNKLARHLKNIYPMAVRIQRNVHIYTFLNVIYKLLTVCIKNLQTFKLFFPQ